MKKWLSMVICADFIIVTCAGVVFPLPVTDGLVLHLDANSITGKTNGQTVGVTPSQLAELIKQAKVKGLTVITTKN